jgi:hypothetical protein
MRYSVIVRTCNRLRNGGNEIRIYSGLVLTINMCDCEELEFEDFEVMLSAISKRSAAPVAEAPAPVPQLVVAKQRK